MSHIKDEDLPLNLKNSPREIADDILYQLAEFCEILERLSIRCAECVTETWFISEFTKLIDGISTLVDGLSCAKKVLKLESDGIPSLRGLEKNLLQILQELLIRFNHGVLFLDLNFWKKKIF